MLAELVRGTQPFFWSQKGGKRHVSRE